MTGQDTIGNAIQIDMAQLRDKTHESHLCNCEKKWQCHKKINIFEIIIILEGLKNISKPAVIARNAIFCSLLRHHKFKVSSGVVGGHF